MRHALFLLLLTGCAGNGDSKGQVPQPKIASVAKQAPLKVAVPALAPEELAVANFIYDHASDPDSVEFDRWGPHDLGGSLRIPPGRVLPGEKTLDALNFSVEAWQKAVLGDGEPSLRLVRVRFRLTHAGRRELLDVLFALNHAGAAPAQANHWGDNWTSEIRTGLSLPNHP